MKRHVATIHNSGPGDNEALFVKFCGTGIALLTVLAPLALAVGCSTSSSVGESLQPMSAQASFAGGSPAIAAAALADSDPAAPQQMPGAEAATAVIAQDGAGGQASQEGEAVQLAALAPENPLQAAASNAASSLMSVIPGSNQARGYAFSSKDHECLARAMFFESNRSSRDGLVAVGSVVMNRLETGKWGNTVCSVVGAPKQFAPGVLTRQMDSEALPDVMEAARAVLKGERHPKIYKDVMFFHTAGYRYPYDNMHYVVVAGGNSFYEKRRRMRGRANTPQSAVLASAREWPSSQVATAVKAVAAAPVKAIKAVVGAEDDAKAPVPVPAPAKRVRKTGAKPEAPAPIVNEDRFAPIAPQPIALAPVEDAPALVEPAANASGKSGRIKRKPPIPPAPLVGK